MCVGTRLDEACIKRWISELPSLLKLTISHCPNIPIPPFHSPFSIGMGGQPAHESESGRGDTGEDSLVPTRYIDLSHEATAYSWEV